MIKDIVVHLTGSEEDDVRLAYAEPIARSFSAHLTGLQVHTMPEIIGYTDPTGSAFLQQLIAESYERAEAVTEKLSGKLSAFHLARELRRLDVLPGDVGRQLAAETRTADLFVGTRPYGDPTGQVRVEEEVLLGSGRGCLFAPPGGKPPRFYSTILVAWNGSRESARAVAEALPFLAPAQQVLVAIIEEHGASEQKRIEAGADIGRYLSRHDISAEIRKIAGWDDASKALMNEARQVEADMLVMGGYGHSRFRERILGGATRRALSEAEIPVLMAH
jgi:nucleotide-binding universal stress UspA family protein